MCARVQALCERGCRERLSDVQRYLLWREAAPKGASWLRRSAFGAAMTRSCRHLLALSGWGINVGTVQPGTYPTAWSLKDVARNAPCRAMRALLNALSDV
jgi:hypothetical protein